MAEMDDQQLLSGLPLDVFEDDLRTDLFAISSALIGKFANNSINFKLELYRRNKELLTMSGWRTAKKKTAAR